MTAQAVLVRILNSDGTDNVELPSFTDLTVSPVKSQQGAIELSYPLAGVNRSVIAKGVEVRVIFNDVERPGCRFILEDNDLDDAKSDGDGTTTKWTGRTYDSVLEQAIVMPTGFTTGAYFTSAADPSIKYTGKTAGFIMNDQITAAKTRGCFPNLDISTFSSATDSGGNAWTNNWTHAWTPGTGLNEILDDLVQNRLCEYEIVGRSLKLYDVNHYGVDRSPDGVGQVALFLGRDLLDSPNQGTTRGMGTVALVQGTNHYVDYVDATSVATYGRREVFLNESNIDDQTTLRYVGQQQVQSVNFPQVEKSHTLNLENPNTPLPWVNFGMGDWVLSDLGNNTAPERHRIVQFTLQVDGDGLKSCQVTFDSFLKEVADKIQAQLDAIANGSSLPGSVTSSSGETYGTPNPPSSLSLGSYNYLDNDGTTRSGLTMSWADPTANTDGSPISNLMGIQINWRYHTDINWQSGPLVLPGVQIAAISPLKFGQLVDVQIYAVETNGHVSSNVVGSTTIISDVTPPPMASTPTIDVATLPLTVRIGWDGKDSTGAAMPADFGRCEVHVSTVNGFTPSASTLKDVFYSATSNVSDYEGVPGTTYYARLLAFDKSNNPIAANWGTYMSAQASGTPRQAVDGELASLTITKLLVGTLGADMTVSARIKTANTGARVEMNSGGLFGYNPSGTQTFKLDSTNGTLTVTGAIISGGAITGSSFATDVAPNKRITMASGGVFITSFGATISNLLTFYTGSASEVEPGYFFCEADSGPGTSAYMWLQPPRMDATKTVTPRMYFIADVAGQQDSLQVVSGSISLSSTSPVIGGNAPSISLSCTNGYVYANRLRITSTQDIDATAGNLSPLQIGDYNGAHMRFDGNEIQAVLTPGTGGFLGLNISGGNITLCNNGGDIVTCAAFLDISQYSHVDNSSGNTVGDRIALHSSGYGIGIQSNRTVLYVTSTGSVAVQQIAASGDKSGNTTTYRPILASAFTVNSLRESKTHLKSMPDGALEKLDALRPVIARSKNDTHLPGSLADKYFLVAEEVEAVDRALVGYEAKPHIFDAQEKTKKVVKTKKADDLQLLGNDLAAFVPLFVKGFQELHAEIDSLRQENRELRELVRA